jgi:hypothetical protein
MRLNLVGNCHGVIERLSRNYSGGRGGLRKPVENLKVTGVPAEIRTEHHHESIAMPLVQHVLCRF